MDETLTGIQVIPAGTVLLQEGELAEAVYILISGRVAVTRAVGEGGDVLLAELGEGEAFGEMSLIDEKPCSATVRTVEEVKVRRLTKAEFTVAMQKDVKSVQVVMKALFSRMRNMNLRVVELERQLQFFDASNIKHKVASKSSVMPGTVTISAITDPARHALGEITQLTIHKFPYRMGRWSLQQEKSSWFFGGDDHCELEIHDIPPYSISRKHCHIEKKRGRLYLVDSGSKLGFWLNGERFGGRSSADRLQLQAGNVYELHLGSSDSNFAFKLQVE
ncbi:MAG: cyclic nucleotide-binding domain-containing protein [Mariprofundaceae bacterium]